MVRHFAPVRIFLAVSLFGLMLAVVATLLVTRQPWLGLRLTVDGVQGSVTVESSRGPAADIAPGQALLALAGRDGALIEVTPTTLIEEPDQLADFAALDRFRAEQDALASALRAGPVTLHLAGADGAGQTALLTPEARRPVSDLPPVYWLQIAVGLCGLLAGAWVWSLAPLARPQAFVMLTGVGLALSSTAAAIYSTRELALPAELFAWFGPINLAGSMTFGAGMIGLFLSYPTRIGPGWLALAQIGVIAAWVAAAVVRLIPAYNAAYQLPIVTAMLVLAGLVIWQSRLARRSHDLPARAALRLFGLSILIGAGSFVVLISLPKLLGFTVTLSQGHAFALFLVCYIGLVLAVRRYRIFNLEQWSFRLLFYAVGALLLVALDAALIYGLSLERAPALGVSLFAVAFLYLPLRDMLARRLARWRGLKPLETYFRDVSAVAMTKDVGTQAERWNDLLQAMFQPLAIEPGPRALRHVRLEHEGVELVLPAVPPVPARRLKWAGGGRRLFSDVDVQRAEELVDILAQLIEGRKAYETGASEERGRIARDIHDNIGIQLLGALHSSEATRKDVLIRETLADLREIIDNKTGPGLDLGNLIADLRLELSELLEAAGLAVNWPLGDDLSGHNISPRIAHALRSVLREAVNNAVRHARASTVGVAFTLTQAQVRIVISDDGRGFDTGAAHEGQGVANMQVRVSALGGRVEVAPMTPGGDRPGTRIVVELPLIRTAGTEDELPEAAQ